MSKRIIYAAGWGKTCCGYSNWMSPTGFTNNIKEADLIVGLGGSDVSPQYYNQPDGGFLSCNGHTDAREYEDYKEAIKLGKKIIGICKGAQWLSALAGGSIFQHVEHPYIHEIESYDGKKILCNSLHHNLADLSNLKEGKDFKLLAWANSISPCHFNGYKQDVECEKEPEVVFYPEINGLGFQNHNEMLFNGRQGFDPMIKWSQNILEMFMNDKL